MSSVKEKNAPTTTRELNAAQVFLLDHVSPDHPGIHAQHLNELVEDIMEIEEFIITDSTRSAVATIIRLTNYCTRIAA